MAVPFADTGFYKSDIPFLLTVEAFRPGLLSQGFRSATPGRVQRLPLAASHQTAALCARLKIITPTIPCHCHFRDIQYINGFYQSCNRLSIVIFALHLSSQFFQSVQQLGKQPEAVLHRTGCGKIDAGCFQ